MWKTLLGAFKKDNLYQQALAEACEMLETDGRMFEASVESLRRSDTAETAVDIYGLDKKINRAERDVRKKVMTHLVVSGGAELAHGLALVSVVIDIERIGDYTKNIHDLARRHPARLEAGPLEPLLSEIETGIADAFRDTIRAFKDNNEDLAREVMAEYKEEHSSNCEEIIDKVIDGQSDLSAPDAAAVALYTRYLKRIGSHSRNIATSIVNPFHRIGYKEEEPPN
jgi:phosphate uptake regulator